VDVDEKTGWGSVIERSCRLRHCLSVCECHVVRDESVEMRDCAVTKVSKHGVIKLLQSIGLSGRSW
jgi:hypothetical protein